MINVKVWRNPQNDIVRYAVRGHSNIAPMGKDIVCAAVSVLAQTSIIGLYEVLGQRPRYSIEDGLLECTIIEDLNETQRREATLLLETMLLGFQNIQQQYPDIIVIDDEEVS
ncbi:ribosomal-processing cysteine protease Prp [Anoxynatronum sibiricum]|uniref:Ribosomal processing cysteine protease Prp n=1 Tax=Anoxynatronum sibiricum TaxID=210623 RepID=A0ABU9VY14_9CLOT